LGQHRLGGGEVPFGQAELVAHHLDDAPASGVHHPARDVLAPQAPRLEEALHRRPDLPAHERSQLAVEDDLQPRVAEPETHEVGGAGEEEALGAHQPVQETLTTRSTSAGRSSARSSARRAVSAPAARAMSMYRSFCRSKSRGAKTSSIGTTLARRSTPAVS